MHLKTIFAFPILSHKGQGDKNISISSMSYITSPLPLSPQLTFCHCLFLTKEWLMHLSYIFLYVFSNVVRQRKLIMASLYTKTWTDRWRCLFSNISLRHYIIGKCRYILLRKLSVWCFTNWKPIYIKCQKWIYQIYHPG